MRTPRLLLIPLVLLTMVGMALHAQSPQETFQKSLQAQRMKTGSWHRYSLFPQKMPAAARPAWIQQPSAQYSHAKYGTGGSSFIAFMDASKSWENGGANQFGFYQLQPGSSVCSMLFSTPKTDMNGGGAIYDGKFHGTSWDQSYTGTYHEYNLIDWSPTENDGKKVYNYNYWGATSAYDPTDGKVYLVGLDNNTFEYVLVSVDFNTFSNGNVIKKMEDNSYPAMAFDAEGQLWAVSPKGILLKVDKKTGDETVIGDTGVKPGTSWESAAFDYKTGKLYWAATEYNTKASHLYEVDTTTGKATAVSDYLHEEVFPFLYIESAPDDAAPADITDLAVIFHEASTLGEVKFTLPSKTYGGQALSGDIDYSISIDGIVTEKGTAEAGTPVSETVSTNEGQHVFSVVLRANGKSGSTSKLKKWVGNDHPAAVGSPDLNIDGKGKATLSWTAPTAGAHGGHIGKLTYSVFASDGTLIASDITGTEYQLSLDAKNSYKAYYYYIAAYNGTVKGEEAMTPYVCFGQPLSAPYVSDFSSMEGAYTYDFVDNDNNGITWGYDADTKSLIYFSMHTNYKDTPDDWIVTPPFTLKADRQYTFSYDARCYSESDREVLLTSIADGNVQTVSDFRPLTATSDTIHTIVFKPVGHTVTVGKDGVYRLGIRAMENTGLAVYVRNIKLTEGCRLAAPDSVSDLTIIPDKQGEQKASISFKAPVKTIGGNTLSALSKIEVFEKGSTVPAATVSNPQPGKTYTVSVAASNTGNTTYNVLAANSEGYGATAHISAYIGEDTPLAPKNIRLVDNLDGTCKLVWEAPGTVGVHGGYVYPDHLTYEIYTVTDNTPSLYKSKVKETECSLGAFDEEDRIQRLIYYAMKTVDGDNKSEYGLSTALLSGAPYNLPVKESWTNGMQKYFWATNAVVGKHYFKWFNQLSSDNDKGCAYYGSTEAKSGDCAVLSSGKISLVGSANPRLSFNYYFVNNGTHKIAVSIKTAHGIDETIKTIDYEKVKEAGAEEGWQNVMLDLSEYKEEKYVTVSFRATIGNPKALVLLDNFRVRDVYDYDLSAHITGSSNVTSGAKTHYNVIVRNEGMKPMSDYRVSLYVNDNIVESKTMTEALAANAERIVGFDYDVPATADNSMDVKAKVAHDFDMDENNDESEVLTEPVYAPSFPAVNDLKASKQPEGVVLHWSSTAGKEYVVTDNFERYAAWSTDNIGSWTLVDGDKNSTFGFGNQFPKQGTPFAYIVFNPSAVGDKGNNLDPHSGSQYLASFSSSQGANDDWLISPGLSGRKQTVKFWAKTVSGTYGSEEYEVLYSASGKDVADFQLIKSKTEAPAEWTETAVELPAGARYFAIRCVSNNHTMFVLDDISYEAPAMTPVGYKVYKNGECVATLDATKTTYTDGDGKADDSYFVTVLYADGESKASNIAVPGTDGIETIVPADHGYKVLYRVTHHVYVVKKDGKTFKAMIKSLP
ncbi:choice-of-anchor J domain-containing protein [Prevotella multiformis]|uniref:choice-of-anchor J domain-containing protein n=1 Tax=Prevotella multiformis TaxID=282402 RepID=UPI001BA86B7D|nr:choice-of-anchor J domain-containing protein [Prevotella multiformis]QUB70927.1 choice-of-anchor J domain-containing protein [Prevotella multiformis]